MCWFHRNTVSEAFADCALSISSIRWLRNLQWSPAWRGISCKCWNVRELVLLTTCKAAAIARESKPSGITNARKSNCLGFRLYTTRSCSCLLFFFYLTECVYVFLSLFKSLSLFIACTCTLLYHFIGLQSTIPPSCDHQGPSLRPRLLLCSCTCNSWSQRTLWWYPHININRRRNLWVFHPKPTYKAMSSASLRFHAQWHTFVRYLLLYSE